MRILYLYRYLGVGGTGTQLMNRLGHLMSHGVEVHFGFLHDLGGRGVYGDYPHIHLFAGLEQTREFIEEEPFDVITVIDTPEYYSAVEAAAFPGVLIHEAHTTFESLDYIWDLRARAPMHAILTPSEYNRNRILYEYGYENLRPVYVAPNCLDVTLFRFTEPRRLPDHKVLIWVGRLDDFKNWRGFLALAERISQLRGDCEFWLIGGRGSPDEVAQSMLRTAARAGLCDRLRWIQNVDYQSMPAIYSLSAASGGCHVVTSVEESFGMTIIEAMACGCPVIASRVGAIPELMDEAHAVGLYTLHDTEAAVSVLQRILDDRDLRRIFTAEGVAKVHKRYTLNAAGAHYLSLLEKICAAVS